MIERIDEVLEKEGPSGAVIHEGDVQIVEYADGVLKIRLTGHCSGCPSARLTTEELIAAEVQKEIPEVKEVVLVNEISRSFWISRKLLNHNHGSAGMHMRIGIKYCGGCNPVYNRGRQVKRLQEQYPEHEFDFAARDMKEMRDRTCCLRLRPGLCVSGWSYTKRKSCFFSRRAELF